MPADINHPAPYVIVDGKFIVNLERVTIRFVAVPSTNKLGKSYEPYIFLDGRRVVWPWEIGIFFNDPGCPEEANANTT